MLSLIGVSDEDIWVSAGYSERRERYWLLAFLLLCISTQCTPESNGERLFAIRENWSTANSNEGQFIWWMFASGRGGMNDAMKWVCVCKYLMKNRRVGHW